MAYRPVGATGRIFTYVAVTNRDFPAMALVQLDDAPAVRLPAPIVDCRPSAIRIGMPVRLVWIDGRGCPLPAFTPSAEPQ